MLLPALSLAREKAYSLSCKNNFKQVGFAFQQYALDFDDRLPADIITDPESGQAGYWTSLFVLRKYAAKSIFCCPSRTYVDSYFTRKWRDKSTPAFDDMLWMICEVGYNFQYLARTGISGANASVKLSSLRRPSSTVMAVESADQNRANATPSGFYRVNASYSAPGNGPVAWPAHQRLTECNVVYTDGHVTGARGGRGGEGSVLALYNTPGGPLYGPWTPNSQSMWDRH